MWSVIYMELGKKVGNVFLTAQAKFMGFFLCGLNFQIGYKGFFKLLTH
jgi:hypothetical protein